MRWQDDLELKARAALPVHVHRHFSQGAGEGVSAAEALTAWSTVRFTPRVLQGVDRPDLTTSVLGQSLPLPIGVAPTSLQRLAHPDGELAMARGVAAADGLLVVSSNAGTRFADLADTGVRWWLQCYVTEDRAVTEPVLEAAVAAGAGAVVLTVDTPVVGTKQGSDDPVWGSIDDRRATGVHQANFDPGLLRRPGAVHARSLLPADIGRLGEQTGLPVVVKGVLSAGDARRSVEAGAAAVWVSNHGGRQLDRVRSTASALPEVAASVGDAVEVYVDGGVRSGLDVLAAVALGARTAFLGRLPLWALVQGEQEVAAMHARLGAELAEALLLSGVRAPADAPGIVAPNP